ncbi:hypothetical protein HYPSUDRAFT_72911 [Hypholoma sublateritium FD-334 SS-4]|uniref:CxC6 like cysteine cluster associated with KDZ domain-containing protein n=1 Tax=Hypholoma sublateritium (strain FD-334 SS-4) TaxID=945553 RepID=A0A0D2N3A4_HYPSF|nr:hypothetical protein HYPSUDRAFT_72911 [Hypholoma sublateritium FD-334 SS-4]
MSSLHGIHEILSKYDDLSHILTMEKAMRFVWLASYLKQAIIHRLKKAPSIDDTAPLNLPPAIHQFLASAMQLTSQQTSGCWEAFQNTVWDYSLSEHSLDADSQLFYAHGREHRLMSRSLYPPMTRCNNPLCTAEDKILKVTSKTGRRIVVYTFCSFHITACNTTYHNNYSIQNRTRTYYPGVPEIIEVSKHHFIHRDVATMFINLTLISWTSTSNSAEIYNLCLSKPENQPAEWGFSFDLRSEDIWEAISHLAILEHFKETNRVLIISHGSEQKDRLKEAIQERNTLFMEKGQPERGHYCEKCVRFFDDKTGSPGYMVRTIVSDGVTIGHPCCNVAHCPQPLLHKRKRFCPGHEYLEGLCAVEGCLDPIIEDSMTCNNLKHREMYKTYQKRNGANFQLKKRLERTEVSNPPDEDTLNQLQESHDAPNEGIELACDQKSSDGNRPLRARFGRCQTHSEQLMVRPCGVIVARATFFGSETVPQTIAMLKQVFREPGSMPEYLIYDNCCGVYNHLQATFDPLLCKISCPVDAFHFDCKHKSSDIICREHCNPRKFPELVNDDGTWYFNSSKCEQTNAWLGGYHAILREMGADRYNFLLDELIMRKNRNTVQKLEKDGHLPSYILNLHLT